MSDEYDYGSLLVLQHGELVHLGALAPSLEGRDARRPHRVVRLDLDGVPELADDVRGVLVLGGFQSVLDRDTIDFMPAELDLLRAAVDRELPVLGICLGAQLLATALGGRVERRDEPEVVLPGLTRTAAAADDDVFAGWPDGAQVVLTHEDQVVELPEDGTPMLTGSDGIPGWTAAEGRVHAVQFHPEADGDLVQGWLTQDSTRAMFAQAGVDPEAFLTDLRARERFLVAAGVSLVMRWVDAVVGAGDPTPRKHART